MSDTKIYGKGYRERHLLLEHAHAPQFCYPTLADPVTVTASAAGWTLGDFVEIVPVNTITSPFDIHYVEITTISANDLYELHLFAGSTFIGMVPFTKSATGEPQMEIPLVTGISTNMGEPLPANSQIQAKLACKSTNARTCDVKIIYHTY